MSDRTDRSERLRRRFERPPRSAEGGSAVSAEASSGEATSADDAGEAQGGDGSESKDETAEPESSGSVKERPSTLMYLPNEIDRDLDLTFDEVNLRYRRAFDEKLEKNRDYYPLVAVHGLRTLQEWDAAEVREALSELHA